jgi:DNA-binding Lrp family transcriptional regulator
MTTSYVLLNSEINANSQVKASLKQVESVEEVFSVYGSFDFIIKIKTQNLDKMRDIISNKIRRIPCIKSTVTLRIVE